MTVCTKEKSSEERERVKWFHSLLSLYSPLSLVFLVSHIPHSLLFISVEKRTFKRRERERKKGKEKEKGAKTKKSARFLCSLTDYYGGGGCGQRDSRAVTMSSAANPLFSKGIR